jgi:hypothetical protein
LADKREQTFFIRFEVSTAVTMMIIIFWEMTPPSPDEVSFLQQIV